MPIRVFLDTSFVLALINQRDQYHDRAKALSFKFEETSLVTTVGVLLEIGNALAKDFRTEALAVIGLMRTSSRVELVEFNDALLEKALAIYKKYSDKSWGLVDCISFVVMRERDVRDVLTFDADFTAAGFNVIPN
jgi:predicted nucleic acid-binding protein